MTYQLYHGDCLDVLPSLEAQSVDAVIADIPSGRTACAWDSVIPFEPMWKELKRVAKRHAPIVLLGCTQPFTSALVMSNVKQYRHSWVWKKNTHTGFNNARYMPMRNHEDIIVFSSAPFRANQFNQYIATYNPQGITKIDAIRGSRQHTHSACHSNRGRAHPPTYMQSYTNYPLTVLEIDTEKGVNHPTQKPITQKPIALLEYLVKTYTNEGDTVLDFCMGSGTCGHACGNLGRRFVGIEKDADYFKIAEARIAGAYDPLGCMAQLEMVR